MSRHHEMVPMKHCAEPLWDDLTLLNGSMYVHFLRSFWYLVKNEAFAAKRSAVAEEYRRGRGEEEEGEEQTHGVTAVG